jgi:hypothetical protein
MKVKLFIAGLSVVLLCAFTISSNKNSAVVDQKEGLYVFMLSKPTAEYEYLGSVKKGIAWTGSPEEMLDGIIKKVKKEYPRAEGVIFTSMAMDKADAVIFK